MRSDTGEVRPMTNDPDDRRTTERAELLPEEKASGSDDPTAQAEAVLDDSDRRQEDRNAAPGTVVEHRRSETT